MLLNPSLLLKAAALPEFADEVAPLTASQEAVADKVDRFAVSVGAKINQVIPGVISTEVDARLSFDTEATIAKAEKLIGLYDDAGIGRDRVLIKVAATWEGIRAAEILEQRGIQWCQGGRKCERHGKCGLPCGLQSATRAQRAGARARASAATPRAPPPLSPRAPRSGSLCRRRAAERIYMV